MTRYYIFSNPGSKEKYTEVSEQRFINEVINSKTRYYISFNYVLLECSREEFKADQAEKDRSRYISQLSTGVYPTFFSFDEDMDQFEDLCDNEDDDAYEQAAVPDPIIDYKMSIVKDKIKEVAIPEMIIKLKQGAGRLIRCSDDKGIVSILDPRASNMYRMNILNALSEKNSVETIDELAEFWKRISNE